MRVNLAYLGPEHILHIRRDMLMFFKYKLEEYGVDVSITYNSILDDRVNILFGTSELTPGQMKSLQEFQYIVYDSEVVTGNTMNHRATFPMPEYLEFLSKSIGVLTVLNLNYWMSKGINASVIHLGYTEKLKEIQHKKDKDIDIFFFGLITKYRENILNGLVSAGLRVEVQGYGASPYFLRNSFIERSKIIANITQGKIYNHSNELKLMYLGINGCCTVTERSIPDRYEELHFTSSKFIKDCVRIIKKKKYTEMGETFAEKAKTFDMNIDCIIDLLEGKVFFGPWYKEIV